MARTTLTLFARKRWNWWPAMLAMVVLGRLGILRDTESAAKWLTDHAMRFEVEKRG